MDFNEKNTQQQVKKYSFLLIILCWIVYACSYIGKLGYTANIIQIEKAFSVSHSESGTVSSFFFFTYGAGQIINGIFCKKYNIKYVVFFGLILSGLSNLLISVISNFAFVKYIWILNGGALSVLWTSLIRFLSETLDEKYTAKAVVIMGTTVATGTFIVYGLSSLFVALNVFKLIFLVAGFLLPTIAVIWLVSSPKLAKLLKSLNQNDRIKTNGENQTLPTKDKKALGGLKGLGLLLVIFAIYSVMTNLIKDGLTTWVPTVLNEAYGLPDYASILLTLLLPLCAIFGVLVVTVMHKKIKSLSICALSFAISCALIGAVIGTINLNSFVVTVVSFALVSCLTSGINNVLTSMIPLYWKNKINSGLLAGVLNGFCYVGSTISSYGLGSVADKWGWNSVFWLLFSLCLIASAIGLIEWLARIITTKKNKNSVDVS